MAFGLGPLPQQYDTSHKGRSVVREVLGETVDVDCQRRSMFNVAQNNRKKLHNISRDLPDRFGLVADIHLVSQASLLLP